jgi:hypothetical protein
MTIINQALGAEMLGTVGSTFLFGVTLVQAYKFAVSDYSTTPKLRLFVAVVV